MTQTLSQLENSGAFIERHIGPDAAQQQEMLNAVGAQSLNALTGQIVPKDIQLATPPLFIMLDGTWTEARKMFRKSPYLDALPIISVDLSRISAYHLREAHADGQYCTAEVAIALLDLAGDAPAAAALGEHFTRFRTRYLAGKTQHKGSITAGQVENV